MPFTGNALLTDLHGIIFGGLFLLAFSGGLFGLSSLQLAWVTRAGFQSIKRSLVVGTWVTAIAAWLAVLIGTYLIYPLYRAVPPPKANLTNYPQANLLAHPNLSALHTFGMEWKEHIAWLIPLLATAVAFVVMRYTPRLVRDNALRRAVIGIFVLTFVMASIAAALGILLNKAVPIH